MRSYGRGLLRELRDLATTEDGQGQEALRAREAAGARVATCGTFLDWPAGATPCASEPPARWDRTWSSRDARTS
jgi:hypothetical protein